MKSVLITGNSFGFGMHATVEAARNGRRVYATIDESVRGRMHRV